MLACSLILIFVVVVLSVTDSFLSMRFISSRLHLSLIEKLFSIALTSVRSCSSFSDAGTHIFVCSQILNPDCLSLLVGDSVATVADSRMLDNGTSLFASVRGWLCNRFTGLRNLYVLGSLVSLGTLVGLLRLSSVLRSVEGTVVVLVDLGADIFAGSW